MLHLSGRRRPRKSRIMTIESIKDMLEKAQERNASDLHITAGIPPKLRIDGVLENIGDERLTPEDTERFVREMLTEHASQVFLEKGEADFSYIVPGMGRYRVNVFRQRGSCACVMRIVNTVIPTPESLGLADSIVDVTNRKKGLVLVTGPTGSGKTTTLASLINVINSTKNFHIITLEDPIEYLHRHNKSIVNQREIGVDSLNYVDALRAALREDPDVILLGEMRDLDTISTAITAAETGHLVFSTLHTTGAANTIDRIIDVFPPSQQQQIRIQVATVLESVISQQLVPCEGGGRIAAFEIMHTNPAIRNLIREAKTHQIDTIIQTSRKAGMLSMDEALIELAVSGRITKETALEYAQDQGSITRKLGFR